MKVQPLHPPLATRPAGIHGRGRVACQCAFVLYGEEAFIIHLLVHCSPIASDQKLAKTIDDEQDRRRGVGDGDHQWDRAFDPVLPRDPQLAGGVRDFAAECTNAPFAVMELSLAHAVGNAVVESYARSDLLELRRALMDQWAGYLEGDTGRVVPMVRAHE